MFESSLLSPEDIPIMEKPSQNLSSVGYVSGIAQ